MTWSNRIVFDREKNVFVVAEVFYDDDGVPAGWAETGLSGESEEDVRYLVATIAADLIRPGDVLLHPEDFPGDLEKE